MPLLTTLSSASSPHSFPSHVHGACCPCDKIPCRVYAFIETMYWDAGPNQAQSLPYNTIGRSRAKWWTIPRCWASSFQPLLMSTQISQRWPKESCLFVCIWRTPECYLLHILHLGLLHFDCDNHWANMAQDRSESQVPSALTSDVTRLLPCWCDQAVSSSELLCIVYWICRSQETPFARIIWVHFHSRWWLCIQVDTKPTHLTCPNHRAQDDNNFSKVKRMPPWIYLNWNSMRGWVY